MKISLLLCQVFLFLTSLGCHSIQQKQIEIQTRETNNAIAKSEALQELNRICVDVKLPDNFTFMSKGGIDDQKLSLAYRYYSEIPFNDARKTFEKYFADMCWSEKDLSHRYPKQLEFTNNQYLIAISFLERQSSSNYSIYCEKLNNKTNDTSSK